MFEWEVVLCVALEMTLVLDVMVGITEETGAEAAICIIGADDEASNISVVVGAKNCCAAV